jgi:FkbM family methyltransferase
VRSLRKFLRSARDQHTVNWLLSTIGRTVYRRNAPSWLIRHLPRHGLVAVDLPGGVRIRLWSRGDDYITSRLWWMGMEGYEKETVTPFLRFVAQAHTVLDVGAYTGYYALAAAATNPQARVFAFEANPRVAARLGRNLDLNPDLSITVIQLAVGSAKGTAEFHLGAPGLALSSSLAPMWKGLHRSIPVAVTDLDSFVTEWGLTQVDVIKIDVEAVEDEVIQGMSSLLLRDRPVLFLEVLPGQEQARLSTTLRDLDYEFYYLTFAGPEREEELVSTATLISHAETPYNHLACPREKVPPWLRRVS